MIHLTDMSARRATDRLADWQSTLRAENKSPRHRGCLRQRCDPLSAVRRGRPPADESCRSQPVDRRPARRRRRAAPGTARFRQLAVRRFASWLTAGGEIHTDPFPGVKAARVEPPIVDPLTDDELRALIATCAVPQHRGRSRGHLHHRRDEAIIRLMFETAIRSGEVIDLQLEDVDMVGRLITIRRGKGGRGRGIPVGQATTEALLRYLGERDRHPLAALPAVWLGNRGKQFRSARPTPRSGRPLQIVLFTPGDVGPHVGLPEEDASR